MKPLHRTFFLSIMLILFSFLALSTHAKKWVVSVQNYSFTPYNLTHVKAGDTIQWVWVEGVHTTTSTSIPQGALEWDYPITQQEPSAIMIPMVNGTYEYVCTPHAAMGMKGTFTVTGALGIQSQNEMKDIWLYPNPATDRVNVLIKKDNITCLRIFGMSGIKVREMSFDKQPILSSYTIDLTNLPNGIFFFEFTMESDIKKVMRVVHTGK